MYGVSVDEVTHIITAEGGETLEVRDDESAGPNWISHTYFVRRPTSRVV
jgi:hypothetical protein